MTRTFVNDNKPTLFTDLGNGKFYYNFDITEEKKIDTDEEGYSYEVNEWSFIPIYMPGIPTCDDCIKYVIRNYISIEDELNLINTYNSYKFGIIKDASIEQRYISYLEKLQEIKLKVRKDFNEQ